MPARSSTAGVEDAECTILHVDMDAFYVSVELLTRPELRGRPVIAGSPSGRSVVLSASYEARRFGVRSAMPMSTALRLCPQAVIVEPHHSKYAEVSRAVMEIFGRVTPVVEPLSVDEAFLDVRGSLRRLGSPRAIGEQIRSTIHRELGITASVGIASTKFVAKIASTRAKPDGLLLIPADRTVEYLHTLPVSALWGVGSKTQDILARLGIRTVEDVARTPVSVLQRVLGATGTHVHRLAWGEDPRPVTVTRQEKSIGAEETFAADVADDDVLFAELLRLSHRTAARLRSAALRAGGVSLKLRYADFSTITRSRRLAEPVDSAHALYGAVRQLLEALGDRPMSVRLIGIRAERLESADGVQQLTIDRQDDNWRLAEAALDRVNGKFGASMLRPARLLRRPPEAGGSGSSIPSPDR
ncbi:DNA polymerase IV [Arthrobacter sp. JZ12]|uniref:DNA polymerase IV n=1 Tax=Arthrobacter sp. JZ12 TaxID=2654190 RepID=UPI002B48786A|nr:DNA polymerase IV [Arthrobacter sp. JZ12]WRH24723.1 DNA polymerase IV [Arthrobacter sp. JZ12]